MSRAILDLLGAEFGAAVTRDPTGLPRVAPRTSDETAAALGLAHRNGWRVRVEGRGTWMPTDAPADLVVTTIALDRLGAVTPADLVATVQAGTSFRTLAATLAGHRTWLALDPPGSPDRSLGSVLATATAGPARHRFGPVKDHVLGTTIATADGRLVRAGGTVVKNVAGFDLTKLQVGGFGGFGIITEANLRLRALPPVRRAAVAAGALDPLFHAARAIVDAEVDAIVVELLSPMVTGAPEWRLLVEIAGTEDGAATEMERARAAAGEIALTAATGGALGAAAGQSFLEGPISIRAGVLPASLPEVADLIVEELGPGRMSLGAGRGGLRWSGATSVDRIRRLRTILAHREIPVTLERAPWPIREAAGHFGELREGVAPLTARVRAVFDPTGVLVAPLEGTRG
ncbi:MAG: FAD-binding oxidoreductase [Gemmatimonadetes bacterium]|nr:FAD-binding oxidoreductase [Gemmatimonadota bacterium]